MARVLSTTNVKDHPQVENPIKKGTDGIQQENQIKPVKNGEGNSKEGVIKVESISDGVSGD